MQVIRRRASSLAQPGVPETLARATSLGRAGRPEEVAEAAASLCSPASAYVAGTSLLVDASRVIPESPEGLSGTHSRRV
ncbi:SDR family oxidoreductase [Phenylobacterium sp.]|uniref:SDR family oxidoreductase n=1 Tax=Phenylobacterium sp. TaxID=1871053 RepID=UPI00289EC518|nr:SDR family oxidoreductase [Phenylobacterium sp.]